LNRGGARVDRDRHIAFLSLKNQTLGAHQTLDANQWTRTKREGERVVRLERTYMTNRAIRRRDVEEVVAVCHIPCILHFSHPKSRGSNYFLQIFLRCEKMSDFDPLAQIGIGLLIWFPQVPEEIRDVE
jgi:hypothetical protein